MERNLPWVVPHDAPPDLRYDPSQAAERLCKPSTVMVALTWLSRTRRYSMLDGVRTQPSTRVFCVTGFFTDQGAEHE
jgi:hypothetical protein